MQRTSRNSASTLRRRAAAPCPAPFHSPPPTATAQVPHVSLHFHQMFFTHILGLAINILIVSNRHCCISDLLSFPFLSRVLHRQLWWWNLPPGQSPSQLPRQQWLLCEEHQTGWIWPQGNWNCRTRCSLMFHTSQAHCGHFKDDGLFFYLIQSGLKPRSDYITCSFALTLNILLLVVHDDVCVLLDKGLNCLWLVSVLLQDDDEPSCFSQFCLSRYVFLCALKCSGFCMAFASDCLLHMWLISRCWLEMFLLRVTFTTILLCIPGVFVWLNWPVVPLTSHTKPKRYVTLTSFN